MKLSHIFSNLNRLVEKSIIENEILLDEESFERLYKELSFIEEENISYYFILNNKISSISRRIYLPFMPEYGAVSAWYVNYCLGISKINPFCRGRRVQQFYRPSINNVLPLFKPISEQHQKILTTELKQEIDKDDNLKNYSELYAEALSATTMEISSKPFFHSMILEKRRKISGKLVGIKGEIITSENNVDGFKFLKYDIFNASFIGSELFETTLINLKDIRLKHNEKIKGELSPIMVHSFMDNLNLMVDNGELLKMSSEDLYEYSLLTIASMGNAIRQFDKYDFA